MNGNVGAAWREHRGIVFVLIIFLVVGLSYSLTTPLFEAPAEDAHFRYVRHIAEGRGLPLIPPDESFPQEHQAPLYYLLAGALTSPIDMSGPTLPQLNPYHVYNDPGPIEDNRNSYYHTPDEAFPYRGLILAVHLARLLALAMGALAVLATYAVAYQLSSSIPHPSGRPYPTYPIVAALGAAAVTAFNPQFVFISNVMSNDTTAAAFAGWSLFFALLILKRGFAWRYSVLLGIVVGLAAISKLNGLAMLPISVLALSLAALLHRRSGSAPPSSLRLWFQHTFLVGVLVTLIAGWWYARNWVLYQDPLTLKLAAERWGSGGATRSFTEIVSHWREIEVGFWGLFGHDNLLMDPFVYDILHVIELLALVGLVVWGIRVWRYAKQDNQSDHAVLFWSGLGLIALSFIATLAGLYRWLQVTNLPAGRYLFPAISPISVMLFLGLSGLLPRRLTPILVASLGIGLLSLTLITPFRYIAPAYTTPPLLASDETISNRVYVSYAGRINLLGYEIEEDEVHPGDWLHVTLYWQPLDGPDADLTVALRVLGREDAIVGSKDTFPGLGRYPTSLWQPGHIVKDTYPVQVSVDAKAPTRLSLDVSLYHHPTMFVLPKFDGAGSQISQLALGETKLIPHSIEPAALSYETHFTLGNDIRLVGYSLSEEAPYSPGSSLELILYWQSLAEPTTDYTVFAHLLDKESQLIANWDAPPVNGDYATHLWSAKEIVEDVHRLNLPPDLPSGDYQLMLGLYQPDTLQRLPVHDAQMQRLPDNAIPLLTFAVR